MSNVCRKENLEAISSKQQAAPRIIHVFGEFSHLKEFRIPKRKTDNIQFSVKHTKCNSHAKSNVARATGTVS